MKRHFLTLADFTKEELYRILKRAADRKAGNIPAGERYPLQGKLLGLLFEKPSLRTRITFEVGIRQLGGDSLYMGAQEVQLGVREEIKDVARNLERYIHGVVLRTFRHDRVEELARYSSIPVINGLTDLLHPCQILSDLLTLQEKKGKLEGLRIAYIGDGNNVTNSWLLGAALFGMKLTVACPKGFEPNAGILQEAQKHAQTSGASILLAEDPRDAACGADVLYTDVWASMGQEAEAAQRKKLFRAYQLNDALVAEAASDVVVMHCLPAHRGDEVTDEVLDGPHSVVFDQAENRLHAQKALMEMLFEAAASGKS